MGAITKLGNLFILAGDKLEWAIMKANPVPTVLRGIGRAINNLAGAK